MKKLIISSGAILVVLALLATQTVTIFVVDAGRDARKTLVAIKPSDDYRFIDSGKAACRRSSGMRDSNDVADFICRTAPAMVLIEARDPYVIRLPYSKTLEEWSLRR